MALKNSLTQNEIKEIVQESGLGCISRSTISRKLKKMKITRKRVTLMPVERNTREKIDDQMIYSADVSRISDENLVFLDETGFNEHARRKYGYSLLITKAYITVPANRNVNRSVMCQLVKRV